MDLRNTCEWHWFYAENHPRGIYKAFMALNNEQEPTMPQNTTQHLNAKNMYATPVIT